ncbi:hypothetical protein D3C87_1500950 [compost metagenome]
MRLGKLAHGFRAHVDNGTPRDIVDEDGQGNRISDCREMGEKPLLGRLVIIGRDDKQSIGAGLFCVLCELDRFCRIVGTSTSDDRHALGSDLHTELDHTLVLIMGKRRRFTRRADRNEARAALCNHPFDMICKRFFIDSPASGERRYERGDRSLEHAKLPMAAVHASAVIND